MTTVENNCIIKIGIQGLHQFYSISVGSYRAYSYCPALFYEVSKNTQLFHLKASSEMLIVTGKITLLYYQYFSVGKNAILIDIATQIYQSITLIIIGGTGKKANAYM